jgi:hypothetical protein
VLAVFRIGQYGRVAIGQVILGVVDLDAATRHFEAMGFTVLDGGVHPGLGTANRVIPLGNAYLELLGVVDDETAEANEFGRSLLQKTAGGDRLVRWSIRTERIEEVSERLGLTPEHRRRIRPDGTVLTWRAAGLELSLREAWLPFFMQWDDPAQFPGRIAVVHAAGECALSWLQVSTPEPGRLARWIDGEPGLPLRVSANSNGAGIDAVAISTPHGDLVIGG